MKKTTLLLTFFGLSMVLSAQTKITFEDAEIGSTGGATAMWDGGTVDVVANTYTTGNPSSKALHVLNTNYLPVYFGNVPIPAGAETLYSKIKVKYLIIGGTDTNYPTLEVFSSPSSSLAGATEKIGEVGWAGLWGTAEIGIWKTVEFTFANSILKPVPSGNLILKLSKSNTEYLIDDVELVLIPVATPTVIVNDFEANNLTDVLAMKRWSTTDASAIVESNPTNAANKSVHILATNWNSCLEQIIALPAGKVLADYDKLTFDVYLNNIDGTDNTYKDIELYLDGTKVMHPQSAGVANAWETKVFMLDTISSITSYGNSFKLDLGINSNKANYYLDNIKLTEKTGTGFSKNTFNVLTFKRTGNTLYFNQTIDRIEIVDLGGRNVITAKNINEINISNLNNGVYLMKSLVMGETYIKKIIN
ncbi:MAG: hypothetical protein PHS84_04110 [Paludibacter sp.]|jgi:hypothetical protein|nr:hypothetical protein [Paludibacter sp.]